MLVIRRKRNQAITIGDDIRVIVMSVEGDGVRLGIEAPRGVPVRRVSDLPDSRIVPPGGP
jgi:carbon storage regulator